MESAEGVFVEDLVLQEDGCVAVTKSSPQPLGRKKRLRPRTMIGLIFIFVTVLLTTVLWPIIPSKTSTAPRLQWNWRASYSGQYCRINGDGSFIAVSDGAVTTVVTDDAWYELDQGGSVIAMDQEYLVIADPMANTRAGSVKVYLLGDEGATKVGQDLDGENAYDGFGVSVDLRFPLLVIGATGYDKDTEDEGAGAVYVYKFDGESWVLMQRIVGDKSLDHMGKSVALSDQVLVLSVIQSDQDDMLSSGHVETWSLETYESLNVDLVGEEAGDMFGWEVELSKDSKTLVVSSRASEQGFAQVSLYRWIENGWELVEHPLVLSSYDQVLSMESDGNYLAVAESDGVKVYRIADGGFELALDDLTSSTTTDLSTDLVDAQVVSLSISGGGHTLVVGLNDGTAHIYDLH